VTPLACEKQVVVHTAAVLSESDSTESAGLELILDTTADMIEEVFGQLPVKLGSEAHPAPNPVDPRIPALRGQSLLVGTQLGTLKRSYQSLRANFARTWRIIDECQRENEELKE
jgi:hypothetical protein